MQNCYFCKNFIFRITNPSEMSFMCLCKSRNNDTMQGWIDDNMNVSANFECCELDKEKLESFSNE